MTDSKEAGVLRSTLATLETRFREVKELYNAQKRELDEAAFENETMKATIERLKLECQDSSDREAGERKQRHALEMSAIELKKKLSEAVMAHKETEEAFKQSLNEIAVMRGELTQHVEQLKAEKRKALALDRELEQLRFLAERKEKEHRDNVELLTIQVKSYKAEAEDAQARLELVGGELQARTAKENKESSALTTKIRDLESREASLMVSLEDLQKKLAFYKEKATRRDYNSVSKHSILEKLASVAQFVAAMRESWATEMFIVRQEMSCMASLLTQTSDVYFQSLKPKQLRRHIEQNITSKIFSRFSPEADAALAACSFGPKAVLPASRPELPDARSAALRRAEEELLSLSSKITPKKPLTSELSATKKTASPPKAKEERKPLADLKLSTFGNSGLLHRELTSTASDRGKTKDARLLAGASELGAMPTSGRGQQRESAASFIARVNAKVFDKVKIEPTSLVAKTPLKTSAWPRDDQENYKFTNEKYFEQTGGSLKSQQQGPETDGVDYKKIERESEEIARRIQALKLKDYSHLKR